MTVSGQIGQIITSWDVENAVVATIKKWSLNYIREVEGQKGLERGTLRDFQSYLTTNNVTGNPLEQTPMVVVVSTGTSGAPERRRGGLISAWWRIEVAIAVQGAGREETNRNASFYLGAVYTLLQQKASLGGFAGGVNPVGVDLNVDQPQQLESLRVVAASFDVLVHDIVDAMQGPLEPIDPYQDTVPAGDWPRVPDDAHVHITVDSEGSIA